MNRFQRVEKCIDGYRAEVIELETMLTAIPAISPASGGTGELKKCVALEAYLRGIGVAALERIDAPDAGAEGGVRPNLIARMDGKSHDRTVWIMSHLDVVPEGDLSKWHSAPFEVRVDGDKIFGRGVEDDQQGMVASIMAVRALIETKTVPCYDVALLFVADEEVGSDFGIKFILQERPGLFSKDDIVLVPDGGLPDGSMIEVAEKTIAWLKITTKGKQTHGSTPAQGVNAHVAAAHTLVHLNGMLYRQFRAVNEVFEPPISTFEATKKEANVLNVNTIPGEDVFCMDCRLLPEYRFADMFEAVHEICLATDRKWKTTTVVDILQLSEAAPPTATDAPVVTMLAQAIKHVYGISARPMGIGGGTVAAYLRRAGIPAAVWNRSDETMHGPNEYALLSNILGDAKVMAHVMLQK